MLRALHIRALHITPHSLQAYISLCHCWMHATRHRDKAQVHSSTVFSLTHDIWCTSVSYNWLVKCHMNLNLNRNTFPFLVAMYIVTYVLCTRTSALSDIALQFGVFGFWLVRVRSSTELDMVKKSIWHRVYNPVKSVAVTHKRHPTMKNKRPSTWVTHCPWPLPYTY